MKKIQRIRKKKLKKKKIRKKDDYNKIISVEINYVK